MAEYIKREAAVDAASAVYYDTPDVNLSAEKFEAAINAIPAADVVEVVRCKDCKYAYINSFSAASGIVLCSSGAKVMQQDDFCSYGERKDEADAEG